MLVPRSYKYQAPPPPPQTTHNTRNKSTRHAVRKPPMPPTHTSTPRSESSSTQRTSTQPVVIPSPKQSPASLRQGHSVAGNRERLMNGKAATVSGGRAKRVAHDPNALPPAVAALLAMTTIPPRRPNRFRASLDQEQHMSIEELVSSWKNDDSLGPRYGSPRLSMLLEDIDDAADNLEPRKETAEDSYDLNIRSSSSESMPSLEADDRSVLSFGSPSTPESLRSRKSLTNLRRDKSRNLLAVEDCPEDHPLVPNLNEEEEDTIHLPVQKKILEARKSRSSFKSNLTLSLQSLRNAALQSISSFGRPSPPQFPQHQRSHAPTFDDALWSHPFLFPSFSSEVRPAIDGKASKAQRRYLNPMPLTFEEQEAPFQRALHAPYLRASQAAADEGDAAPTIPMQTYIRGVRRKPSPRRAAPDPTSEAGRALLGGSDRTRQREVRENSDFLRIVVMEMNMRRVGKLESGRAKIWLPPRDASPAPPKPRSSKTPERWVGVSAY